MEGIPPVTISALRYVFVVRHAHRHAHFVQVDRFLLDHAGCVECEGYSCVEDPRNSHSLLATLTPLLYQAPPTHTLHTSHECPEPMIAIAMETKFDMERNSKVQYMRNKENI